MESGTGAPRRYVDEGYHGPGDGTGALRCADAGCAEAPPPLRLEVLPSGGTNNLAEYVNWVVYVQENV